MEQIAQVRAEVDRLDNFNREVYERKHEELIRRVEELEKKDTGEEAAQKRLDLRRRRIYAAISIALSVFSVIVIVLDQIVLDHLK